MKAMKNIILTSIAAMAMAVSFTPVTAFASDVAAPEEIIIFEDNNTPDTYTVVSEDANTSDSDLVFFENNTAVPAPKYFADSSVALLKVSGTPIGKVLSVNYVEGNGWQYKVLFKNSDSSLITFAYENDLAPVLY